MLSKLTYVALVLGLMPVIAQADQGVVRVKYDADLDRLIVANLSDCPVNGLAFGYSARMASKSRFKRQREGEGEVKSFAINWVWSDAMSYTRSALFQLPPNEVPDGIAPSGYRAEEFKIEHVGIVGALPKDMQTRDFSFLPGAGLSANWMTNVRSEDWKRDEMDKYLIIGTLNVAGKTAELLVEDC